MIVIKPKDESYYNHDSAKVFLAGSIEMGAAEDWQSVIPKLFKDKADITFFNPRRDDWDSSWEQKESNPEFNYQVNWELDKLDEANVIFMYFSPETKSPISLLELGLYAKSDVDRMIVVCPDGFWRKGNVDIVCNRNQIPIYETLDKGIGALQTKLRHFN
jgi:hypothetical protein